MISTYQAARFAMLLPALGAGCAAPGGATSPGTRVTIAEVEAMEGAMLEQCRSLVGELGPGWTIASHPHGAILYRDCYDRLEWVCTGQYVRLDCFETRKIATLVTDDGDFRATILDLTGRSDDEIKRLTEDEGWDGCITTCNSSVAGAFTEQRLYLFLLVGEVDGERREIARNWCQAWRACPQNDGTRLEPRA